MYYLNSRYYDAETGRFINADDPAYLDPESINGLNLYSYCGNNPIMRVDETGKGFWDWLRGIGSVLMIAAGVALCFVPGAQFIGAGLIIAGAGGLIGGSIGVATGYGFSAGWDIGTLIGGAIGLTVAAPQLLSLTTSIAIPTGFAITTAGTIAITTTVVAVPVGAIAVGATAAGLIMLAEHTKNKSKSRWDRHSGKRSGDPEKGDIRRPYKKGQTTKVIPKILIPFFGWLLSLLKK